MKLCRLLIAFIFLFTAFGNNNAAWAELKDNDLVPVTGDHAGVKAGDIAPDLALYDLDGKLQTISFKETPMVIISLYTLNGDVNKVKQIASLYAKRAKDMKLLFVVREEAEYARVFLAKHDLSLPVFFEQRKEFSTEYNASVPSMVIIDKNGIVRYNNTFWIDANSLDSYLENLIKGSGEQAPNLKFAAPKEVKKEVPRLVNLGETVPADVFRDLEGYPVKLDYTGKPTVLFYWMSFTNENFLNKMLPVMQKVYDAKGTKANIYTVNGSGERRFTMSVLDKYYTSVPTLVGGDFLQYSRSFPALVMIDRHGVLRYRPDKFPDAEELEEVLTQLINED